MTIKPDDQVTVTGWQARDRSDRIGVREVTFADGKKLIFGPEPAPPTKR